MIAPIESRAEDIETFWGSEGQRVRFCGRCCDILSRNFQQEFRE
jgi:hypothetical protein